MDNRKLSNDIENRTLESAEDGRIERVASFSNIRDTP